MRESTAYQAILKQGRDEGRVREAQRLLLIQGEIRFGAPDETTRAAVEAIRDLDLLERLSRRVVDTKNNGRDALLSTP